MKKLNLILEGIVLCLIITSCSPTNRLTMNAIEPAPVFVHSDVQKIGILNRSTASEANKTLDKIDQILSLEGLKLDKEGSERAVQGLFDELEASGRFAEIVVINDQNVPRGGLAVLPASLPWKSIENLCETYNVDAIFSLEFYDTDTRAHYKLTKMTVPNDLGIKAEIPAHGLTLNTQIKNGWRIYDPQRRLILDEFSTYDLVSLKGAGINPVKAFEAIIGRKEAVLEISNKLGINYAYRLRPINKRIARDYYVRGTDNFKIAQRRAQTGDWDGAADLWEEELSHPKTKVAGRACYNMAIINEINGDLDAAMKWASKAYSDYNDNNALRYLNTLKFRLAEKRELEYQLSK
ncbi:DUF6340 family protein [Muriicola sp. Z0-33]|uniref:DUF6340 family protein n=1 Tax=Muriicola sp. Z0-33 TaxID=2816957 RepID=UPI002238A905|nr:DUF6340 family protein [Muriicola sp. Z0-33]MCW5515526.1 hypothetical protein [Muriicola sp. Z0-33]